MFVPNRNVPPARVSADEEDVLHDHRVEREPYAIVKGRSIDRYTFRGWLVNWMHPLFLSADLPGALGIACGEELVDASSEEELEDDPPEEESTYAPLEEELELEDKTLALGLRGLEADQKLIWDSNARGGLRLGHSSCLEIIHKVSYSDFLWVRNLLLNTKDVGGGRILAARPRGGAGRKNRHYIVNLFGFRKLILWVDMRHHPAINKSREAEKLRMSAHALRTDRHLRGIPAR
ncbi:hypothetical protein Cgig2_000457 [Carnegiea gigantea]|uniref:Uncharacterized protein n=1 Tax=Carnegiea gigantea TaxID=171969 RepID=A0A9Q1K4Z2_9CARY|nr:hypothetical protein Cgig2_000457 [Carnegiea gigantea]